MNVYLIRHAHAKWMPDEGRPLSKKGRRDAMRVAELLAVQPITAVISSPYERAAQTVDVLASRFELAVQVEDRFRERTLGKWSANSFEEAVRRTWLDAEFSWPGGESNKAAKARAIEALGELTAAEPGDHIVIGTHGNLLTLILNHFIPRIGYDFWSRLTMPDVYHLEIFGGRAAMLARLWIPEG